MRVAKIKDLRLAARAISKKYLILNTTASMFNLILQNYAQAE
jgi:hypothetical protein